MNVLDLFSGIGGFSLGLERAGMRTVAFCEIEPFPRAVLAKHWPHVPCYEDIHDVTADRLARDGIGRVDLISGGYPCQPFSHAGKQRGHEDPRHLWPQMRRVIGEVRPTWVVAENVVGHITLGLDQVLADLEADGYTGRAIVVPACAKDAPHIRQRVWIMARDRDRDRESACTVDAEAQGLPSDVAHTEEQPGINLCGDAGYAGQAGDGSREGAVQQPGRRGTDVADANIAGSQGHWGLRKCPDERPAGTRGRTEQGAWLPEPPVGRVAHGVPRRVDRLKALGNAVVPQVVEEIARAIIATERQR
jgi:DNA (cytosine-5)-methyltransferase 1